jgi:hypothetical protein
MPQPMPVSRPIESAGIPRQHHRPRPPSVRQLHEQNWRTLVGTYRLFSRLLVDRTKHHLVDEAESASRHVQLLEEELEDLFPVRWPRLRPQLLSEQAARWAQPHEGKPRSCSSCQLQRDEMSGGRIDLPPQQGLWG